MPSYKCCNRVRLLQPESTGKRMGISLRTYAFNRAVR